MDTKSGSRVQGIHHSAHRDRSYHAWFSMGDKTRRLVQEAVVGTGKGKEACAPYYQLDQSFFLAFIPKKN